MSLIDSEFLTNELRRRIATVETTYHTAVERAAPETKRSVELAGLVVVQGYTDIIRVVEQAAEYAQWKGGR